MKIRFLLLFLLLCGILCGCFYPSDISAAPSDYTYPNYEDMEIYQSLRSAVTDDSTLEEMLNAFAEMCRIPVETTSEMFLYEVYSYEFDGQSYLMCHIVRQVDEPHSDEYIQLCLDIEYLLDEDLADFEETTWIEADAAEFLHHIRSGKIYETLTAKPIHQRYVAIYAT